MAKSNKKKRAGSILDVIDQKMDQIPDFGRAVEAKLAEIRLQQAISKIRERAGISQAELAKRIKRSQPWIAKAETQPASNMQLSTLATVIAAAGGRLHLTVKDANGRKIEAVELTAR